MSASFLFLSAAVALGADPAPPPAPPVAAPITVTASGCGGCGAPVASCNTCDPCAPRVGLFDRLRASWAARPRLFGNHCNSGCAPAPTCAPACAPAPVCAPAPSCGCGQPVFTGFTTSCNDPCQRVGLLAKLRAKFHGSRSCDACSAPQACASCGSSVANFPVAPGTAAPPPDKMPAPTDPKKDEPKKDVPKGVSLEPAPVVDAPRVPTLGGTSGKY